MSDDILRPPTVSRCPRCGFAASGSADCEACGATLPLVGTYKITGPRLTGAPPVKRQATGGWLSPVILVLCLVIGTLGGLWYYFAPQIAEAGKNTTVVTSAVRPPAAQVGKSVGLKNTSPGRREEAVTLKATPIPAEVSVSLVKPERASAPPAPARTPAPSPVLAPSPTPVSSPTPGPTPARADLIAGTRALSKAADLLSPSPSSGPARKRYAAAETHSIDAVATPDPVRQLALAHARRTQVEHSSVKAPIILGEEAFATGRAYVPGNSAPGAARARAREVSRVPSDESRVQAPASSGLSELASVLLPSSPPTVADLDSGSFQSFLQQDSATPVVVDFWAPWCGPCRKFSPIYESVAAEYQGRVRFARVNVQENEALARRYRISSLPTLVVFRSGSEKQRVEGGMSAAHLKTWVEASR